jgi:hypothetical protein
MKQQLSETLKHLFLSPTIFCPLPIPLYSLALIQRIDGVSLFDINLIKDNNKNIYFIMMIVESFHFIS